MYTIGSKLIRGGNLLPYKTKNQDSLLSTRKTTSQFGMRFKDYANELLRSECFKRGYNLLEKTLGQGAYAKVRLAKLTSTKLETMRHFFDGIKELNPLVAIKIINKRVVPSDFLRRFLPRELANHSSLPSHPHVIQMFEYFWNNDYVFVVMEYCENGDLLDLINKNITNTGKGLEEDFCTKIFKQMCQGIQHIHNHGVVHRDLKCENIMLTSEMNIRITDFGFSCRVQDPGILLKTACGSYVYSAPEVIKNNPYNGFKTDVWSAGIILFSMVNGRLPFSDSHLDQMDQDMRIQKLNFDADVSFDCIVCIRKLLVYNPLLRPSLEEILDDCWLTKLKLLPRPTNRPPWINPCDGNKDDQADLTDTGCTICNAENNLKQRSTTNGNDAVSALSNVTRRAGEKALTKSRSLKQSKLQRGVVRQTQKKDDKSLEDHSKIGFYLSPDYLINKEAENQELALSKRSKSKKGQKSLTKNISTPYVYKQMLKRSLQRYRLSDASRAPDNRAPEWLSDSRDSSNSSNSNSRKWRKSLSWTDTTSSTRVILSKSETVGLKVKGECSESNETLREFTKQNKNELASARLNEKERDLTIFNGLERGSTNFNETESKCIKLNDTKPDCRDLNKTKKCFGESMAEYEDSEDCAVFSDTNEPRFINTDEKQKTLLRQMYNPHTPRPFFRLEMPPLFITRLHLVENVPAPSKVLNGTMRIKPRSAPISCSKSRRTDHQCSDSQVEVINPRKLLTRRVVNR